MTQPRAQAGARPEPHRGPGAPPRPCNLRPFAPALTVVAAGVCAFVAGWPTALDGVWDQAAFLCTLFAGLHAAFLAGFLFAGVAATGLFIESLITVEMAHKAILAGVAAIPLAFAQMTGSGAGQPESADAARAGAQRSEIQLGIYGGANSVSRADAVLFQPPGTDMTIEDVHWRGKPYEPPPYYGLRATWWPGRAPALGVMLDFTHAKAIAERDRQVGQRGTRDGEPVPPRGTVADTFRRLEYSHGLNFVTLNAVYRFRGLHRRVLPYFGAGIGILVPHTEIARAGLPREKWTYHYELSGVALQGLAGVEWRIRQGSRFPPFTEYKLGYARNHTELLEGGWVKTNLLTQQTVVGLSAYVRPPLPSGAAR